MVKVTCFISLSGRVRVRVFKTDFDTFLRGKEEELKKWTGGVCLNAEK